MSITRAAVVQDAPVAFDLDQTLVKVRARLAEAAQQKAQIVVFPEAFLGGYPKGNDFGARVGMRSPAGRELFQRYWASAIDVPGPVTELLGEAARQHAVYLVIGVIERDGGTLYCTALFFAPDGALKGKHRKLMPTASERLVWGQGDGSTLPVFDTQVGRIGAVICWENYMPMLRQAMYGQRINVWCAPTVDEREIWQASMRHIAYEGRCFVLSACQFMTAADAPPDHPAYAGMAQTTELIRGGSVIISPLGEVLAGPVYGREAVLVADIDPEDTIRGKYDLDVVGHYARPDIFSLKVNTTPRDGVNFQASDELPSPS